MNKGHHWKCNQAITAVHFFIEITDTCDLISHFSVLSFSLVNSATTPTTWKRMRIWGPLRISGQSPAMDSTAAAETAAATRAKDVQRSSLCNCVVNFLLQEGYLLTAFELLHELVEDGRHDQAIRLRDFFSDPSLFPPDLISRFNSLRGLFSPSLPILTFLFVDLIWVSFYLFIYLSRSVFVLFDEMLGIRWECMDLGFCFCWPKKFAFLKIYSLWLVKHSCCLWGILCLVYAFNDQCMTCLHCIWNQFWIMVWFVTLVFLLSFSCRSTNFARR